MEVSVYHNILLISSNNNEIYLWDYEYFRVLGVILVEEDSEPTVLTFINGYSLILVGTNRNQIYLINFSIKD